MQTYDTAYCSSGRPLLTLTTEYDCVSCSTAADSADLAIAFNAPVGAGTSLMLTSGVPQQPYVSYQAFGCSQVSEPGGAGPGEVAYTLTVGSNIFSIDPESYACNVASGTTLVTSW